MKKTRWMTLPGLTLLAFFAGLATSHVWTEEQTAAAPETANPEKAAVIEAPPLDTPPSEALDELKKKAETATRGTPFGPELVAGLRSTPGCLRAEGGKLMDGRVMIFGWFEDKAAVERWYYGPTHQKMLDTFYPHRNRERVALANLPDDIGPLMAVAVVRLPEKFGERFPDISIEVYQPVRAGLTRGDSFMPKEWIGTFTNYGGYGYAYGEKTED